MMVWLPLSSMRMSAQNPTDIDLEAGYVDPNSGYDEDQRSLILIPHIGIDDYTLTFYTSCDGYTLQLLDENDNIAFVTRIPIGATSLVFPSYLSGTYRIEIIRGYFCFWGFIHL